MLKLTGKVFWFPQFWVRRKEPVGPPREPKGWYEDFGDTTIPPLDDSEYVDADGPEGGDTDVSL